MNDNDQEKKAKIILNSEIQNELRDESNLEDDTLDNPKFKFNYSYRGFKKISGWWILLFLALLISIPLGIIYIIFLILRSIINFIF